MFELDHIIYDFNIWNLWNLKWRSMPQSTVIIIIITFVKIKATPSQINAAVALYILERTVLPQRRQLESGYS